MRFLGILWVLLTIATVIKHLDKLFGYISHHSVYGHPVGMIAMVCIDYFQALHLQ